MEGTPFSERNSSLRVCLLWSHISRRFLNKQKQSPRGVHKIRGVYKIHAQENFAKLSVKHLCQSLLFNRDTGCTPANFLKRDSDTDVFLEIFRDILKHPFYRTPLAGCRWVNTHFYHSKLLVKNNAVLLPKQRCQVLKTNWFANFFIYRYYW